MDQRAGGRRAGHSVRQPGLQRQLRRFAHGSARAAAPPRQSQMPIRPTTGRAPVQQILNSERPQAVEQQKQANRHGGIAHAGHNEGFARRQPIHRILIPEPDEQIAAQADALPTEIQQQEIVRQQRVTMRGDKQVHVGEEAAVTLVVVMNSAEYRWIRKLTNVTTSIITSDSASR